MPKIKTKQSVAKRFRITKNKKVMKITGGQDHFNARDTGQAKRKKRRDKEIGKQDQKNIRRFLPYA